MNKAKLSVILKADELVVAESDDPALWQRLLGVIQSGSTFESTAASRTSVHNISDGDESFDESADPSVIRFAKAMKVSVSEVIGALSPSSVAPYVTLNPHNWEAFKKATPAFGADAVSAIGLAGTILALWFKEAKLDIQPTQAMAKDVLQTINIRDANPSRGVKNTKWLMARAGGVITVNPAQISKAADVVRKFCAMQKVGAEP